nr:G-type lectin S-receptor-like serine/threonine-protein kinase At1g67520 [Ipomoea batatas]
MHEIELTGHEAEARSEAPRIARETQEEQDDRSGKRNKLWTKYPIPSNSEQTTVWVAWVGQTQTSFIPKLTMEVEGRLVIHAENETVVNHDQQYPYVMNTTATLLDTGNLVLRGGGRTLWQSFDHPTANTWIPGMKIGRFGGLKTRQIQQRCLSSWTSEENPLPGDFSLCVDPNNAKQLVGMRGGSVYWHSGVCSSSPFPSQLYVFTLTAPIVPSPQQVVGKDEELPFFPFKSIEMATNYFSHENKLGQGGFGPVYKAWDLWIGRRISDLIDPTMEKTLSVIEATRYLQVGLLCVQDNATDRPTMSDVVSMLGNELVILPAPKQPGFSAIIGLKCDDGNNSKACSINEVTITETEGR